MSASPVQQLACSRPAAATVENLVSLLHQCRQKKDLAQAQQLHAYMRRHRLDSHGYLGNYLVPVLVDCGSLPDAQRVFDCLPYHNIFSWTALISGYVDRSESQHALDLYPRMQQDHVQPNNYTFVALLKACTKLHDIDCGKEMHADILRVGLEGDLFIGNTLVDMYAKHGLLAEARQVLDKLLVRDVVSWNALVAVYADQGPVEEALNCFEQMQHEGVSPDDVTFACSLKACSCLRARVRGQLITAEVICRGLEGYPIVSSTMIDMYAKCGLLTEARKMFATRSIRDAMLWNALIAVYAEHGDGKEVLSCFEQMQLEGVPPADSTFVHILKACGDLEDVNIGQDIHADITKRGIDRDVFIGSTMIDMYGQCGMLTEARQVLNNILDRDTVSWNALIAIYAELGLGEEALSCFIEMQHEAVSPNDITFSCSLKACGLTGSLEMGRELHNELTKRGLETDLIVATSLVGMYGKCGLVAEGQEVFDKLTVRDVVSWTAMIKGYGAKHDNDVNLQPNSYVFVALLKACINLKDMKRAEDLHTDIIKKGLEGDPFIGSTLVDMYGKYGFLEEAHSVLDKLPVRGAVTWNALIAAYADHGYGEETLCCFSQMQLEGVYPVAITFACSLKACGIAGALETGYRIHLELTRRGWERDSFVGNSLVGMYAKCGSLTAGKEVFNKLLIKDTASWNTLIKGYGDNHEGSMAVQCFEDMQEQGVKPNAVTFTCLLAACSHGSLVLKGQEYFKLMVEHYEIEPILEHYVCMVDLLARSGHVYDAEEFAQSMQCLLSEGILRALLTGCKIHGEVELALRCFQHLVQVNREDASAYLLMADVYASAGMWSDANRIEGMRKNAGAKKKAANASIEVNRELHEFLVGVKQSNDISTASKSLRLRLKREGYLPNLDLVLVQIITEEMEE